MVRSGQGQVTSQVHKDDFVGTALGGNAAKVGLRQVEAQPEQKMDANC